jgi:hypothetical protein
VIGFLADSSLVEFTLYFSDVLGELCQLLKLGKSNFEVASFSLGHVFVLFVSCKPGMLEDILNDGKEECHIYLSRVIRALIGVRVKLFLWVLKQSLQ